MHSYSRYKVSLPSRNGPIGAVTKQENLAVSIIDRLFSSRQPAEPQKAEEPAFGIVVGEQQGAEPRPRTLGVGPVDHHQLFPVQASYLDPQPANVNINHQIT